MRDNSLVQAHFLLGPAGSGKTFRCLAQIRAALAAAPDGPPLILLAPKQATFQSERQLLADPALSGYTRLQILSFDRLAQFALAQRHLTPPDFLSDEGRVMVLRALLMQHERDLKLFSKSARRPGFAQEISGLLNEFQQHQVTPARLRTCAEAKNVRPELQAKLHDLALLLEAYTGWLADHALQDANHLLDFATAALRQSVPAKNPALKIQELFLDGFADMTPQELDLLAAALPHCERATLAFCLDEAGAPAAGAKTSWLSLWAGLSQSYHQCRQRIEGLPDCHVSVEFLRRGTATGRFAGSPPLATLEAEWAQPGRNTESPPRSAAGAVQITACLNPEAEAVFAAREILKLVQQGARFRGCTVVVRHLRDYHKPLARAFHRYGIPFFLDRRESVAHHPLAELTRSALRTVTFDWAHDDWFAALKAGFVPVAETEIDRLENESLAHGWRGKKWREPFEDEFCECLRQTIMLPFEKFSVRLAANKNQPHGAQLAAALRELWNDLKVEAQLETWSEAVVHDSEPAIHLTVWEQMNSWLDNLALAFPREPMPLRDWLPILEAGLATLTVGVIPPALDQVLVGAIDRARNPDVKFALVLGVNESVFPAAPVSPVILTDADRDQLGGGVSLGPDLRNRLSRERYYGYIACTRASERLAVTFARTDADGNALNPSPFINHLQEIFPGLEEDNFSTETGLAAVEHPGEIAPLLATVQRSPASAPNWQELLAIPALDTLAKSVGALHDPDPAETLSPALAEKLYGPVLRTSVSRVEEFAACPFKFFVRSGLRAEERKVFELDARERGNFQHDVLKVFHERLAAAHQHWRDLTPAQARERISAIANELMVDYREGLLRASAESQFAAQTMTEALEDFVEIIVGWMHTQYQFDPAAAELEFDDHPGSRAPGWEIPLGDGHRLLLHGRIDRVDLCPDPNGQDALAVVIDYKAGGKKLDPLLVEHGMQLQLLTYLNVLRHWKNPQGILGVRRLVPTGVFYVNLRGEYKGGGTRDEILADAGVARRKAYRHTGRFDADALDKLDSIGAMDQFNYKRNLGGELRKGLAEALPHAAFEALLDHVEVQLRDMGEKIFSGMAQVDPYYKSSQKPCDQCDYHPACRIDPWTHPYRVLREAAKENAAASGIPD